MIIVLSGIRASEKITVKVGFKEEDKEDAQCVICKQFLHISGVSCTCSKRFACPTHAHLTCECSFSSKKLLYRYSIAELSSIHQSVEKFLSNPSGHTTSEDNVNMEVIPEESKNCSTSNGKISEHNISDIRLIANRGPHVGVKRRRDQSIKKSDDPLTFSAFLTSWKERSETVFRCGGSKLTELSSLIRDAEQFLWAGEEVDDLRKLYDKLVKASQWAVACKKAAQNKISWDSLEEILGWQPPPVNLPILGRLRSLRKSASEWREQAREATGSNQPVDISVLENLAASGSKLHVTLPDVATLQARLLAGQEVRAGLKEWFCTDAAGVNFEAGDLKRLQQKAAQSRVSLPELEKLHSAIRGIESWQAQARHCLELKSALPRLHELLEQVNKIPAYIPEVKALQSLVIMAENWKAKAANFVLHKDSLKKMREHLHAGERLSVELPEVLASEQCDRLPREGHA